jgi:hypothetical protein
MFNCFRSSQNKIISAIYLISWIFIGNYVLLNLFLAILLDGFSEEVELGNDDEVVLDEEFMEKLDEERQNNAKLKELADKSSNNLQALAKEDNNDNPTRGSIKKK